MNIEAIFHQISPKFRASFESRFERVYAKEYMII